MPPLPRNKVSKRNRLFHSKPPYPPYPLGLFRPFHLSLRSSSSPLHTSVAAKEVLHALEQLKETHDRHMSKNRSLTKEMVLSLSAELDSICLWIHAFISSFQDIHDDEDGFYRRLLFASTTNISRLLVLEAFRGPPATINQHEPSSDSSFDEGHETYEAHPDGFLFRYISNDPFAAKLREKRDFLSDLFIALEWADACDPGLYHSVLCAIILLYDANAVELFAADNHMFIRLLEQFHELPVTGQLFSHQRLSATIFAALYLGGVVRRTFHDRAYLMQILCRKLRLLSVSLVQNEHLDSCRCSQISIGLAVSFCIRSIPLVAGQGGDSQVTRIAIDEGIIESIDRASILLLDASFWSDHGECQTLSPVVAEAMRHIIHHVAASLSFPRIWQSVLKQLKGVNLTSLETLPMTGTAWAVLRKEADRVVFRSILANICRNPNCTYRPSKWNAFMTCGGCLQTLYCSDNCQKAHWRWDGIGHRVECTRQIRSVTHHSLITHEFLAKVVEQDLCIRFRDAFKRYGDNPRICFVIVYGQYPPILRVSKARAAQDINLQGVFYHNEIPLVIGVQVAVNT